MDPECLTEMTECAMCRIRKAAFDEQMAFLNWLSTKPYYEQIMAEYMIEAESEEADDDKM